MYRLLLGALGALALSLPAAAQVQPFPANFHTQEIPTNGTVLHVRIGGQGPDSQDRVFHSAPRWLRTSR